ncbi:MAG: B12-binding domain-containing radical SAM protein [Nanoarchaeota archaeon]|nr:B12-binding domain-containing radical SAM protein [Nanoarchaeota archaeon]
MNILLVYPKYPDTFWSFKHIMKYISRKAAFPPLGLLTVASMLPDDWEKKLVDVNVADLKDEDLMWADLVLISAMIVQQDSAKEIISRCRSLDRKVVAGGPLFTTGHEKFGMVDHLVLDEAEVTLPMFLEDLKDGKPKHIYTSKERPDITDTPIPQWSLINFKDYADMAVQYSRGCPFNCEFCDIVVMNGRMPRAKTPEQLLREFQSLFDAGWRGTVFIVDDNFIGNKAKVKRMLPSVIEWQKKHRYPFKLMTEASVNLAEDEELMLMMSAANFYRVFLGIETPCVESLNECGKVQNTNISLADSVKRIQNHGMQVDGGFILGFDNDPDNIFEAQIRFIQKTGIVTAMVGLLTAGPQTRLWHRMKAEGRLLQDTSGDNTDGSLNFIPIMGREKLIAGHKKILSTIYSRKLYYRRIRTFLKNYRPTVKVRFSWRDFIAFLRSIWVIGVVSRSRFLYWKLLIRTFFTKMRALPVAVELALYWQHFERVAKQATLKT